MAVCLSLQVSQARAQRTHSFSITNASNAGRAKNRGLVLTSVRTPWETTGPALQLTGCLQAPASPLGRQDCGPGVQEQELSQGSWGPLAGGTAAKGCKKSRTSTSCDVMACDKVPMAFVRLMTTFGYMSFSGVPKAFLGAVLIVIICVSSRGKRRCKEKQHTRVSPSSTVHTVRLSHPPPRFRHPPHQVSGTESARQPVPGPARHPHHESANGGFTAALTSPQVHRLRPGPQVTCA